MARVVVENLTKSFRDSLGKSVDAVRDLKLTVGERELLVLVGPSGCGKTTTLRLIAGLEEITDGTVSIDGQVVNKVPPKDRDMAMVFQHHALFPHMTARENMAFGLKLRKQSRAEITRRVGEAADILGLADCLDRRPGELSGGQCQRVALGRALVRKPKVFLFDEPLSNLDAQMRVQMRREIAQLHARIDAAMIYVTHDQVEALTLGDRVAVLRLGVLQQVALPMDLYRRPANQFVGGFIGSPPMNFFNGTLKADAEGLWFRENAAADGGAPVFKVRVDANVSTSLAKFAGRKLVLGIRPEHISEARETSGNQASRVIDALTEEVEPMGPEAILYAKNGSNDIAARVRPDFHAASGDKVRLEFDMRHAHFFDDESGKAAGVDL